MIAAPERREPGVPRAGRPRVHQAHARSLPPLLPYLGESWRRREFAAELSRSTLRAEHHDAVLGRMWLVVNPLMLAAVYFVLVGFLVGGERPPGFFAHLLAGIFAYSLVADAIRDAAKSITSGGPLILNSAFPRVLLPLASVLTAVKRFMPALVVYAPFHVLSGLPLNANVLWLVPLVLLLVVMAAGCSMIVATAQVYFRDLAELLPYLLRAWLYVSPILFYAREVPDRYAVLLSLNPLGAILAAWSDVLDAGRAPGVDSLVTAALWAFGTLGAGALLFLSREREFAVRL